MIRRAAPILRTTLLTLAGCAHAAGAGRPAPVPAAAEAPSTVARAPAALPDVPATHVGREVLRRADLIVRGQVRQVSRTVHGAVVGQVLPTEWLRGESRDDGAVLIVMSPAADALPGAGRDALFVLAYRPASANLELVDVAPLDDADGPARLAGMRTYLQIEAIPDPAARIAALRGYLRDALVSESVWTRSNAAREFSALAAEVPGSLAAEDRPALESALARTHEKALRALLQSALDECPGTVSRARPPVTVAAAESDDVAGATARYVARDASVAVRRQSVIDAAVGAGARAAPLLALALDDESPQVREAAAAAAGEYRVASVEPKISAMLVTDASPVVRRTLVVAAGYLKSASSVPTLAILAKEGGPFSRDAAFALARIRDDASMAALHGLEAEARDADRRDLLRFLASDGFVEQEQTLSRRP